MRGQAVGQSRRPSEGADRSVFNGRANIIVSDGQGSRLMERLGRLRLTPGWPVA
jgi:hypothetical protein